MLHSRPGRGRWPVAALALALTLTVGLGVAHSLQSVDQLVDQQTRTRIAEELSVSDFGLISIEVPDMPRPVEQIVVELGGSDFVLDLKSRTILSPDVQAYKTDELGELVPIQTPEFFNYRGEVLGHPGTEVWVGISERREMYASVRFDAENEWNIQPAPANVAGSVRGLYAAFKTSDSLQPEWTCGVDEILAEDSFQSQAGSNTAASGTPVTMCDIGLDADREFYQQNGSSESGTITNMLTIIGRCDAIYERDAAIKYEITDIIVRTSEPDPYSTNDPGGLLGQFDGWWTNNMSGSRYDVAHLFTGKNISGSVIGIASLSAICTSNRYGLSQSLYTSNIALRTSLTAHELGHNWSCTHCSGGDCRIMCPSNGGCTGDISRFGNLAKAQITAHKNSRTCLSDAKASLTAPFFDDFPTASLSDDRWIFQDGVGISGGGQNEPSPPNAMNLDTFLDDPDQVRSAYVDLQGASRANLSFWLQPRFIEAGESIIIEYWGSNNRWTQLTNQFADGVTPDWFEPFSFALPTFARHDDFRVRFTANVDQSSDDWYVDDVTVAIPDISVFASGDQPGAPPGSFITFDASVTELLGSPTSGQAWISVFNEDFSPWFASNPKFGPKSFPMNAGQVRTRNNLRINVPGSKSPGDVAIVWAFVGDFASGRIDDAVSFTFVVE